MAMTHSVVVVSSSMYGLSNVITCESQFSCICLSILLDCVKYIYVWSDIFGECESVLHDHHSINSYTTCS